MRFRPLWAALLPLLCLLPFINKAVHIDDPVYLYVAQHITEHPLDPYGFEFNTQGESAWMYEINKNPPGHAYYLALIGAFFGWQEWILHAAVLVPCLLIGLGTYRLAQRLCDQPLLATAISIVTPGFVVSCSTLMCEPFVLAAYIWAIVWWIRGLDQNAPKYLAASGAMLGLGILMKFVAVTGVPLLLAYTLFRERRFSIHTVYLLISVFVLGAYELAMHSLYGRSPLLDILEYSSSYSTGSGSRFDPKSIATGLAFLGGSFLPFLFFLPYAMSRRMILGLGAVATLIFLWMVSVGGFDDGYAMYDGEKIRYSFVLQTVIFSTTGVALIALTCTEFFEKRNPESALLVLLILGIFIFATFVNWTTNVRALMPMLPVVGILVVRRMSSLGHASMPMRKIILPVAASLVVSMTIGWADYRTASDMRTAARQVAMSMGETQSTVWFDPQGGFEYYMLESGYRPLVFNQEDDASAFEPVALSDLGIESGDKIVVYTSLEGVSILPKHIDETTEVPLREYAFIATMDRSVGAGFYDAHQATLPYYFGRVSGESYRIHTIR